MDHEQKVIDEITTLSDWLDTKFRVPGTQFRLGMDSIIGIIPGVGDTAAAALSSYIIYRAHQLNVPFTTKCKMGWNVFIDWLIGLIPFVGDIFDVAHKANAKNCQLLLDAVNKRRSHAVNQQPAA